MAARQQWGPYREQVRTCKGGGRLYSEPKRTSTLRLPWLSLRPGAVAAVQIIVDAQLQLAFLAMWQLPLGTDQEWCAVAANTADQGTFVSPWQGVAGLGDQPGVPSPPTMPVAGLAWGMS